MKGNQWSAKQKNQCINCLEK